MIYKYKCDNCGSIMDYDKILIEPNPFNKSEKIDGCPKCFKIDSMLIVCEHDNCEEIATCGQSVNGIFRYSCSYHFRAGSKTH